MRLAVSSFAPHRFSMKARLVAAGSASASTRISSSKVDRLFIGGISGGHHYEKRDVAAESLTPRTSKFDFAAKPRSGMDPPTIDRGFGNTQHLRGFLHRKSGEIAQLHQLGFLRIFVREFVQCFVHGEDLV